MIDTDEINADIAHLSKVLAKFDNHDKERLLMFIKAYLVILQYKECRGALL